MTPGSSILVTETPQEAVSAVLATLGYDVVKAPPSDGGRRVAAAVVRPGSADDGTVEQLARVMDVGGVMVLIARDLDSSRVGQWLDGWRIDDQTEVPPDAERAARVILTRAVLVAREER